MKESRYLRHPGADPQCALCGGHGWRIAPVGEVARAIPCGCADRCTACRGTGWVAASDGGLRGPVRRCLCRRVAERCRLFDRIGIPARHADSRLATYVPANPTQGDAVARVIRYLQEYRPGDRNVGIVLYGPIGLGKTHLLCAMLRELVLEHGVHARFIEFSHLVTAFKASFERGGGAADLLEELVSTEVLAIDELGKGRLTEFEDTLIDEVISRRYNAYSTVLATTNYAPGQATGVRHANLAQPGRTAPTLVDRVGPRVYSRLREMCEFHLVDGDDHRQRLPPSHGAR